MHPPPPLALPEGAVDACYIPFSPSPPPPKKEGKGREGGREGGGEREGYTWKKKVVAITTAKFCHPTGSIFGITAFIFDFITVFLVHSFLEPPGVCFFPDFFLVGVDFFATSFNMIFSFPLEKKMFK